jgi:hypothetical protein
MAAWNRLSRRLKSVPIDVELRGLFSVSYSDFRLQSVPIGFSFAFREAASRSDPLHPYPLSTNTRSVLRGSLRRTQLIILSL